MTTPPPGQALTAETIVRAEHADFGHAPTMESWAENQRPKARVWSDLRLVRFHDTDLYQWRGKQNGSIFEDQATEVFRLASQSTAPTRGEGDDSPTTQEMQRAEVVSILLQYSFEGGAACDVADEILTAIAPTPPEPVASALAEGEGLEVVAWRVWSVEGEEGLHYHEDVAREVAGETSFVQPLVTAEAAAARIEALEFVIANIDGQRTQAEARADRLAGALEPLARLEVPKRPVGNAGAYSILHDHIRAAAEALREPKSGGGG